MNIYLQRQKKISTTYIQEKIGVIILSGDTQIINEQKSELVMEFMVEETKEETMLELPYIYYLGYNIEINGKQVEYRESDMGFIMIDIPQGDKAIVKVKYEGTKLSKITFIVSTISIIGFGIYIFYCKKKKV